MLEKLEDFLSAQSQLRLAVFSLILVACVGLVDNQTGSEISVSIFYLIPVSFGAWFLKRRFGLCICVLSAAAWIGADHAMSHVYSHPAIPFWNAAVRLGFFFIVFLLFQRLRLALEYQASLAELDGLTGLLNARTFSKRCEVHLRLAARWNHPFVLAYIDLDGFKGVNDKLGHSVGDQVLKDVAATLEARLRSSDICARLGGDEFSILLPETDDLGAQTFFAELHSNLLKLADAKGWPIGFSIGVAVFHSQVANPDEAIKIADELMYRVKNSGKNHVRVEIYDDTPSPA